MVFKSPSYFFALFSGFKVFKLFSILFLLSICWFSVDSDISTFKVFLILYVVSVVFYLPGSILSPVNILMLYYGLWFFLAPLLGSGYTSYLLESYEYKYSFALVSITYIFSLYSLILGGMFFSKVRVEDNNKLLSPRHIKRYIFLFYVFSTLMIFSIVNSSGGFDVWLKDPGDAFLNRGGSGVYVILSHFSIYVLGALIGLYSYNFNKKFPVVFFVVWLFICSPVIGSKFQIILFLLIPFLPWLKNIRTISIYTVMIGFMFVLIFILGMVFRGFSGGLEDLLVLFNYFSTLHNLAVSIGDFSPGSISTFLLPFNKFLTPFGVGSGVSYYDMNHLLTDIYYPQAWEIRATEQWPVETDLYLNFYFFGGLPFVFIYMFFLGSIHKISLKSSSLGVLVVSFVFTISMISHLRGSLYNHTDFYMVPYLFFILFVFFKVKLYSGKVA